MKGSFLKEIPQMNKEFLKRKGPSRKVLGLGIVEIVRFYIYFY